MPRRSLFSVLLFAAVVAALVLPAGPTFGVGAPGVPRWQAAATDRAPSGSPFAAPGYGPLAASSSPPPPLDWDPMIFQPDNVSSAPYDLRYAGGAFSALSVSDPTKSALMFGGYAAGELTNQTWLVNQTTAVWHLEDEHRAPSPREDFALSGEAACGVAVLFGGVVNASSGAVVNDTWLFNFTTEKWTNITTTVGPAPRQGAAIAVDPTRCQALLYGGIDAHYSSGSSTGTVQWNDTWVLNLTTHVWSPRHLRTPPPALTDAGLLFDNATDEYLLYGGCEDVCSPNVYAYSPVTNTWTLITGSNSFLPEARGGATWSYASTYNIAILNAGYTLDGTSRVALNDTYVYLIDQNRFEAVGAPTPSPRYGAAAGWLANNGCPGLVLVGGAGAPTDPPDEWFLDEAPDLSLACNTWGNDSISTSGGGPSCVTEFQLNVTVLIAANGSEPREPLVGGSVTASGNCSYAEQTTNAFGQTIFALAYQPYTIWVNASGFHENVTAYLPLLPQLYGNLTFVVVPFPNLVLQTYTENGTGPPGPLGSVDVLSNDLTPVGTTNASGVLRRPAYYPVGTSITFSASKLGYESVARTEPIPYTGTWWVNLTLPGPGPVDVLVEETGGQPLPGALVTVTSTLGAGVAGFKEVGGTDGWANGTLPGGNYTATAQLAEYLELAGPVPFVHPWANRTIVTINLSAKIGYEVNVRVLDAHTHLPIDGAGVQVGNYPIVLAGPSGWANRSAIADAGTYGVLASAENYSSNRTTVTLDYYHPVWVLTMNLTRITSGCTGPAPGCSKSPTNGTALVPLSLWPSGPPGPLLFVGGGALLLLIPTTFVWLARRRNAPPAAPPAPELP